MRRRGRILLLASGAILSAFAILSAPWGASAWQKLGEWPGGSEIELELGVSSSALEAAANGTTEGELLGALGDWRKLECVDLPASYTGATGAPALLGDGKNSISFIQTGWEHGSTLIGFTAFERSGVYITEADVVLNEENFDFVTRRGALPEVNARSILLHELGHVFGLGHSQVQGSAMHANYIRGLLILGADDITGISSLYPADECALCESDDDCPLGYRCGEDGCIRTRLPSCAETNNCAHDEYCAEASGNCVRGNVSPEFLGNLCQDESDCEEGILCREIAGERRCTVECDAMNTRSCPGSFFCDRDGSAACGIGFCAPGGEGMRALGTACEAHGECGSRRCVAGLCALPCAAHQDCPGAFLCHPDRDDGCGACAPPLAAGEACYDNAACSSDLCVELDEGAICSIECARNDDCPKGLQCRGHEGVNLCLPPAAAESSSGCGCQSAQPNDLASLLLTVSFMVLFTLPQLRRRRFYR